MFGVHAGSGASVHHCGSRRIHSSGGGCPVQQDSRRLRPNLADVAIGGHAGGLDGGKNHGGQCPRGKSPALTTEPSTLFRRRTSIQRIIPSFGGLVVARLAGVVLVVVL